MDAAEAFPQRPSVYSSYSVVESDDKYVVQSLPSGPSLSFDRTQPECRVQLERAAAAPSAGGRSFSAVGLLGVIELLSGPYLLVATGRELAGTIAGHEVWRMTAARVLPFSQQCREAERGEEAAYLAMLRSFLSENFMYFSYTFDVTNSLQRQAAWGAAEHESPLWQTADHRFWWNEHICEPLRREQLDGFVLPAMVGFFGSTRVNVGGSDVRLALVSRKSKARAGTRYNTRGVGRDGSASNFAETEQVLAVVPPSGAAPATLCSFVQTRGSVPILWRQPINLQYNPPFRIAAVDDNSAAGEAETRAAFRAHFAEQARLYGRQTPVSLMDSSKAGGEQDVGGIYKRLFSDASKEALAGLQGQEFVDFDFHKECKGMRYDKLSLLLDRCQAELERCGCFEIGVGERQARTVQTGVFRTNCKDSLDRTNVAQALLGKEMLERQMVGQGVLRQGQTLESNAALYQSFRFLWSDNADALAKMYSGTPALKTDFTRTGKRTALGACADGVYSLTRYYYNNFRDGFNQDAIDLFLGTFEVRLRGSQPVWPAIAHRPSSQLQALSVAWLFSCVMVFVAAADGVTSFDAILWIAAALGVMFYMHSNGARFVDVFVLNASLRAEGAGDGAGGGTFARRAASSGKSANDGLLARNL